MYYKWKWIDCCALSRSCAKKGEGVIDVFVIKQDHDSQTPVSHCCFHSPAHFHTSPHPRCISNTRMLLLAILLTTGSSSSLSLRV
mmetsp:Transcript_1325/g.4558  ORF Transcript_1325/g.4558 Transcript_1325/m.4558 type:complete len:85 (+) Transcript_1325:1983-2237(+)